MKVSHHNKQNEGKYIRTLHRSHRGIEKTEARAKVIVY